MTYNLRNSRSKKRIVDPEEIFSPEEESDEVEIDDGFVVPDDENSTSSEEGFLSRLFPKTKIQTEKEKEYESEVPKDVLWKRNLKEPVPPRTLKQLENTLSETRKYIAETEPTMDKILKARLSNKDRSRAVLMFDMYQNLENHTDAKIDVRESLVKILQDASKKSPADFELEQKIESEEVRLGAVMPACYETSMKMKIISLDTTDQIKSRLLEMFSTISSRPFDESSQTTRSKIELAVGLPYEKVAPTGPFFEEKAPMKKGRRATKIGREKMTSKAEYLCQVRAILDEELYGMEKVKDELIEILNNRLSNKNAVSTIALQGLPGTGKTAIVSALAKALSLPFERVCLGGMTDSTVLKGSEGHWLGSSSSVILKFLRRSGVSNGILLFDELDKLSVSNGAQEVQNALLHITDYTQNSEFQDAYLSEFSHDISRIWFIFALNDDRQIDPILRDRLSFVHVPGYTRKDLTVIITKHLLPKALENCGLGSEDVKITQEGCERLISKIVGASGRDGNGVRNVKRGVYSLVSKINLLKTFHSVERVAKSDSDALSKYDFPDFSLPILVGPKIVDRLVEDFPVEKIPDIYS